MVNENYRDLSDKLESLKKDSSSHMVDIELLKSENKQFYKTADKLDKAIDKLQELINNVNTMVSLQQQRLENTIDYSEALYNQMESIDAKHALKESELLKRIENLEKFRWTIIGVAAAGAFVLERLAGIIITN